MQNRQYETLMLLTTKATPEEVAGLETSLKTFVEDAKGSFASFDKWGRYRLAYAVRKQDYGQYILARYELAGENEAFFKKVENHVRVKCHEFVMRHVNVALDEGAFNRPYTKPVSLDEQPEGESNDRRRPRGGRPYTPRGEQRTAAPRVAKEAAPAEQAPAEATVDQEEVKTEE